jgi:hypothetical protein
VEDEVLVLKLNRVDSLVVLSLVTVVLGFDVVIVVVVVVVVAFVEFPDGRIEISAQFRYSSSILMYYINFL